ncbi:hypothetical protein AWB74_08380 [Caballeronia arvi]|uniref:Uncharacterized protein n=1 Tax=Caballeronia arvi TaxID=1777135 RepID=A0A158L4Y0_9BURK|nr:hypothetical protein AWB74_08380 [Caballeronia arvi]
MSFSRGKIGSGELPVRSAKSSRPAHDSEVFTVRHVLRPIAGAHLGVRSNAPGFRMAASCPRIQLPIVASKSSRLELAKSLIGFTI